MSTQSGRLAQNLRSVWETLRRWVNTLDYSAYDYVSDRVTRLEDELARLKSSSAAPVVELDPSPDGRTGPPTEHRRV